MRIIVQTIFCLLLFASPITAQTPDAAPKTHSDPERTNGAVDSNPEALQPMADLVHFPNDAKSANLEGKVTAAILVGKLGTVEKIDILRHSYKILDDATIAALSTAKFSPAMKNAEPVPFWVTIPVTYGLGDKFLPIEGLLLMRQSQALTSLPLYGTFKLDEEPHSAHGVVRKNGPNSDGPNEIQVDFKDSVMIHAEETFNDLDDPTFKSLLRRYQKLRYSDAGAEKKGSLTTKIAKIVLDADEQTHHVKIVADAVYNRAQ